MVFADVLRGGITAVVVLSVVSFFSCSSLLISFKIPFLFFAFVVLVKDDTRSDKL